MLVVAVSGLGYDGADLPVCLLVGTRYLKEYDEIWCCGHIIVNNFEN